MKRILCYGDSNTNGFSARLIPTTGEYDRFDRLTRWTCRLQEILGENWEIVEAGLNGRTIALDDPLEKGRNGLKFLNWTFQNSGPLDLVTVMLGTNDLKDLFDVSPQVIASELKRLLCCLRELIANSSHPNTRILIISPPNVRAASTGIFYYGYSEQSVQKGLALPALYRSLADQCGYLFFDASQYVEAGPEDGVHLTAESHQILARALADFILSADL